ncbi:MAG: YggT family protein [Candidatus Margulisiibacteriota bacterium]|jgi:YggT family protein
MLATIVDLIFNILFITLIIRVLISWVPHNPYHPLIQYLYNITDPFLKPFQKIVPPFKFGIDFSPMLAFIALMVIREILFKFFL